MDIAASFHSLHGFHRQTLSEALRGTFVIQTSIGAAESRSKALEAMFSK